MSKYTTEVRYICENIAKSKDNNVDLYDIIKVVDLSWRDIINLDLAFNLCVTPVTNEFVIEHFNKIHNNRYDYSKIKEIKNNNSYITIICPIHGEFEQLVRSHSEGRGCPKCNNSKGEILISNILSELKYDYKEQVFIKNPYNSRDFIVDFFIEEYNTIIEYNGIQHYVPIKHFGGEIALQKQQ